MDAQKRGAAEIRRIKLVPRGQSGGDDGSVKTTTTNGCVHIETTAKDSQIQLTQYKTIYRTTTVSFWILSNTPYEHTAAQCTYSQNRIRKSVRPRPCALPPADSRKGLLTIIVVNDFLCFFN